MFQDQTVVAKGRTRVGRPKKEVGTESTRIRTDVLRSARKVASLRGIDISQYLSELLEPLVARDIKAEKRKILAEVD